MEAFGRATVEYMLCGLPVIGADSGATPELLEGGQAGLLFPPGDEGALAQRMAWMMEREEERLRMGKFARKEAAAKYTVPSYGDAVFRIYQNVLEESP